MRALLLAASPIALHALTVLVRAALGRRPSRHAINVEVALLLTGYFLVTAALGIFWVANQQLPPFDLHYVFGYATLALVLVHLAYNARIVLAHLRRKRARAAPRPMSRVVLGQAAAALLVGAAGYLLGMRTATSPLAIELRPEDLRTGGVRTGEMRSGAHEGPHLDAVEAYHRMSSHTRTGVLLRAPSVAWDLPVAAHHAREGAPRIALAAPMWTSGPRAAGEVLAGRPRAEAPRFDLRALSSLLAASAGITERRGGLELRASASSGALFPTELSVLAHDVDGLPPGTYAYSAREHALVDLGRAPPAGPELGLDAHAPPTLALVATAVFRRTGQKYRDRAYRYVVADTGHTLGNAIVAAADLGLHTAAVLPQFDDGAVERAVGVDGVEEGVIAMLALGDTRRAAPAGTPCCTSTDARARFAAPPLSAASELVLGATSLAHEATSLSLVVDDPAAHAEGPDPPAVGPAVTLPPAADVAVDLLALVRSRRSVRTFAGGPLPLEELAAVLDHAAGPAAVLSRSPRVHVVANRVDGLAPGAYRHDATARTLTPGRLGDLARAAGSAALDQEVVAGAPAVVVITVDRRTLAAEGPRGYRHAFLEAGMVGARLYLAAAAHQLGGCSVGAFYDEEAAEVLGVDLEREWPVHIFALGVLADRHAG